MPISKSLVDTLRRVPLFNELSESELASIALKVSRNRYKPAQRIFSEGDKGGDLLIVEEGSVRVVKMAPNGRYQLISIERVGGSLGEVSAFDDGSYSTSAIAIDVVVLLRIDGGQFRGMCLSHPAVALKVIRVLGHRLRQLRQLVEELSFATVRDRLTSHLLRLADERGVPQAGGLEIGLEENNEELAARLGTVRELVSRNLGRLHGEGLILMRKRAVIIPDLERLRGELK